VVVAVVAAMGVVEKTAKQNKEFLINYTV